MVKRIVSKNTIINSVDIENKIKSSLSFAMKKMWQFSFDTSGNNRSSGKTDYLHNQWGKILELSFGDYEDVFRDNFELVVEKEKTGSNTTNQIKKIIDIFGKHFKVDMLLNHNDKIHTVFLLKAPLTSINKNRFNSCLNLFGEINRFYGNNDNSKIKLVFVNFTPKQTFTKDDKTKTLKTESVQYLGLNRDDNGESPLEKSVITDKAKENIHEIHIEYSLNLDSSLSNITSENMLKDLINRDTASIKVDSDALNDLKSYIDIFIAQNNHIFNIYPVEQIESTATKVKP